MESTLLPASTLLTLSKTLKSTTISPLLHLHLRRFNRPLTRRLISAIDASRSTSSASVRLFCAPVRCISSSAASFASGGGGGAGSNGGGGGGGDGSDGGGPKVVAADANDATVLSPDAIILDVGGMTCGGCAAKVKKILENQPQVSSASVNLATETAIVWPISEAKVVPNWQQELGEMLAKHLTNCGFQSNPRGQGDKEGETP